MDKNVKSQESQLRVRFSMFHENMRIEFKNMDRRDPEKLLTFWRGANQNCGFNSNFPFNLVTRAFLSAKASSVPAERLFSDLGRKEGRQRQSLQTSTVEITGIIGIYVRKEMSMAPNIQFEPLHPQTTALRSVSLEIVNLIAQQDTYFMK